MCVVYVEEYVQACACELRPEEECGGLLCHHPYLLKQGLLLSLVLDWQPVSPNNSTVSIPNSVGVTGVL